MFWVIATAVLAFMLAPILWIIPSPRQRRQVQLRERARELGVAVQIMVLPQNRRQRVRREAEQNGLAYSMNLPKSRAGERWRWWLDGAEDDVPAPPLERERQLAALRDRLPTDAIVVEAGERRIRIFWREANADVAAVDNLAAILAELVAE
ncbi:hypothetical protein [Spongiibacter sp.]|uniref:hypothetical protein n=1 Tax=Spongiibacter sp. TaxID=2024860 RepID=UPI0035632F6A